MTHEMDSVHQQIMDQAYDSWKDKMPYLDFLKSLDDFHRWAVVIGNFNYQVENGGFQQWIDNGYYHGWEYLEVAITLINPKSSDTVLQLLQNLISLVDLDENNLDPFDLNVNWDAFDNAYYAISDQFMKDCEKYFKSQQEKANV